MRKKRTFSTLEALCTRHPDWTVYHPSLGRRYAWCLDCYCRGHERPVTVEWSEDFQSWEITKW